jgi:hypothetical protein
MPNELTVQKKRNRRRHIVRTKANRHNRQRGGASTTMARMEPQLVEDYTPLMALAQECSKLVVDIEKLKNDESQIAGESDARTLLKQAEEAGIDEMNIAAAYGNTDPVASLTALIRDSPNKSIDGLQNAPTVHLKECPEIQNLLNIFLSNGGTLNKNKIMEYMRKETAQQPAMAEYYGGSGNEPKLVEYEYDMKINLPIRVSGNRFSFDPQLEEHVSRRLLIIRNTVDMSKSDVLIAELNELKSLCEHAHRKNLELKQQAKQIQSEQPEQSEQSGSEQSGSEKPEQQREYYVSFSDQDMYGVHLPDIPGIDGNLTLYEINELLKMELKLGDIDYVSYLTRKLSESESDQFEGINGNQPLLPLVEKATTQPDAVDYPAFSQKFDEMIKSHEINERLIGGVMDRCNEIIQTVVDFLPGNVRIIDKPGNVYFEFADKGRFEDYLSKQYLLHRLQLGGYRVKERAQ